MRIGIPRALLYYYYFPFWETFFKELGCEVVVSEKTNKKLIDDGIKITVQEICVPMKILNGHIIDLLDKNVDYIFIPRMVSVFKHECFCPKFMGLPDMLKCVFADDADKFLFPVVSSKSDDISNPRFYKELGKALGVSSHAISSACRKGKKVWNAFRKQSLRGETINKWLDKKSDKTTKTSASSSTSANTSVNAKGSASTGTKTVARIGVIGYVYNIYDEFVCMDMVEKLKEMGIEVVTFEMLENDTIDRALKHLHKRLFWTFSNKLLGAGYNFLDDRSVDGIIHVTAFGCGPDSYIGKMMELEADRRHKPFMTVRVDEHTGESHVATRLEAFVEMIIRKKNVEDDAKERISV